MNDKQIFLKVVYFVSFMLILTSCKKELPQNETDPDEILTMSELQVDEFFEFKTTKTLDLKIVSSDYLGLPATKIEVFNGNPNENGQIFKSGITNHEQVFETQLDVSAIVNQLYVRRTSFDGNIETVTLDITSDLVEYTFVQLKSLNAFKATTAGPDCEICDNEVTETDGKLAVDDGETYCITGIFEGEVDLDGGTLIVCGTLILEKIKGEGTIIINEDGVFEADDDLDLDENDMKIVNYSQSFIVNKETKVKGELENYGTISMEKLKVEDDGIFKNYETGTINISDDAENKGSFINYGFINVGKKFEHKENVFENYCKVIIGEELKIKSELRNASYVKATEKIEISSSGSVLLSNQALIETDEIKIESTVTVVDDAYSKIFITGETEIKNDAVFSGKLNFYDENGIEENKGTAGAEVTFDNGSIPATYCNPGSNLEGGVVVTDTDSDGVIDDFDDYPSDPTLAFNNFYPSTNAWGSLAFEDLWPYVGDFDFNDMIIDYHFNPITNASNNVARIDVSIAVRAIGAEFKNGFGIQLPIVPSAIQSVIGDFSFTQGTVSREANNTESGQDKAVIIFFDNAFDVLMHPGGSAGVNTTPGALFVAPTEINFVIKLSNPIAPAVLGAPPYNAFIFANGYRGREIHLKNNVPTSLADTQNLGIGADVSNVENGIYYQTENGLPWAINIVDSFDYPTEKAEIITAYLHFADWAMNAGTTYADWYSSQAGYRDLNLIY
ncbi:MAG: LruC domain-containing protein [Bacteroidales bacterium]|jgi:LruC domain-containing protein|nr:LruC domain-containing protein [Bacteroidales bacterium]